MVGPDMRLPKYSAVSSVLLARRMAVFHGQGSMSAGKREKGIGRSQRGIETPEPGPEALR